MIIAKTKANIADLCRADDLPSSPLALRCSFNDPRKIQNLNLGATIFKYTRNSSQGGEGIGSDLALRLRDFGQKGGFSNGGKPNESNAGVSAFADIKAGTAARTTSSGGRLEKLCAETGKFAVKMGKQSIRQGWLRGDRGSAYPFSRPR